MARYQPRTIALSSDLVHQPRNPDPNPIQKLHNEMFQAGDPPYASFSVTPMGAVLSNPQSGPQHVSQALFLADRMQFREELGGLTCDEFAARVRRVVEKAAPLCGIQQLLGQQVMVRSLVNPLSEPDTRRLFREGLFGLGEELGDFDVQPQLYGMRMAFPAEGEHPGMNVRIESWAQDPRSLFIEVAGGFGPLVALGGLQEIEQRIRGVYDFLLERVLGFVQRFDRLPDGSGGA